MVESSYIRFVKTRLTSILAEDDVSVSGESSIRRFYRQQLHKHVVKDVGSRGVGSRRGNEIYPDPLINLFLSRKVDDDHMEVDNDARENRKRRRFADTEVLDLLNADHMYIFKKNQRLDGDCDDDINNINNNGINDNILYSGLIKINQIKDITTLSSSKNDCNGSVPDLSKLNLKKSLHNISNLILKDIDIYNVIT